MICNRLDPFADPSYSIEEALRFEHFILDQRKKKGFIIFNNRDTDNILRIVPQSRRPVRLVQKHGKELNYPYPMDEKVKDLEQLSRRNVVVLDHTLTSYENLINNDEDSDDYEDSSDYSESENFYFCYFSDDTGTWNGIEPINKCYCPYGKIEISLFCEIKENSQIDDSQSSGEGGMMFERQGFVEIFTLRSRFDFDNYIISSESTPNLNSASLVYSTEVAVASFSKAIETKKGNYISYLNFQCVQSDSAIYRIEFNSSGRMRVSPL